MGALIAGGFSSFFQDGACSRQRAGRYGILQPGMRLSTDYVHGCHSIYSRCGINNSNSWRRQDFEIERVKMISVYYQKTCEIPA
jgi:hypothetical protein